MRAFFTFLCCLALVTVTLASCTKKKEKAQHSDGHSHSHSHDSGDHHGSEGHMKHMEEVRAFLKKKLGADYDKPLDLSKADLKKGKELYQSLCASCHGTSGKGDGPAAKALAVKPADFTDPAHSSFYSDRGRLWIILNGVPPTSVVEKGKNPMVSWKDALKGEENALYVYAYIKSLRKKQ